MEANKPLISDPEVSEFLYNRIEEGLIEAYRDLERTRDPIEKRVIELLHTCC